MFDAVLWLAGMPRSGTNWVSQILASSPLVRMKFCPLFSYEFKNRLGEHSTSAEWETLFREVYVTKSDYLDQEYLRKDGLVPSFRERVDSPPVLGIKSTRYHNLAPGLLEKVPHLRYIVLVRNPAAAIHSWLTNPLEFPNGLDPRQEWRTGRCRKNGIGEFWGFDDWVQTTEMYRRLSLAQPERVYLQSYEELVAQPQLMVERMFAWAGLPLHAQTVEFLRASTAGGHEHKRSVFKPAEVADRWRSSIDPVILREIQEALSGSALEAYLAR